MNARQLFFRWGSVILVAILLLITIYCALNAYYFTLSASANGIGVAAWSAFASVFLVAAIFIMVANGISTMNMHLEHISDNSDEQVKLLHFIAKQSQPRERV